MKILYLLDQWPIPATTGAKVHDMLMMNCLRTDWRAEIACWHEVDQEDSEVSVLPERVFVRHRISARTFPSAVMKLLLSRQPLHAQEFLSDETRDRLRALITSVEPSVIVLSNPRLAVVVPFLARISDAKIVVDTHDVHVQRCKSIYDSLPPREMGERLKQKLLIRSYAIIEKEIYRDIDVAWALKEEDKALLESFNSVRRVDIVPNVVDPALIESVGSLTEARGGPVSCVFIGDYSYKPNEQSAMALMECFAERRIVDTGALLYLIGVNPSSTMRRRAENIPAVRITGRVDRITDYLLPVDAIFVVPLMAGGGVKRKVIEAMACGCPVITTDVGAEGLDLSDGENAEICPVASFSDRIVRLAEDREYRLNLAKNGQAHILSRFGYERLRESVRQSLLALAGDRDR